MCATQLTTECWLLENGNQNEKNTAQIFECYHARGPLTLVAGKLKKKKWKMVNASCCRWPTFNIQNFGLWLRLLAYLLWTITTKAKAIRGERDGMRGRC